MRIVAVVPLLLAGCPPTIADGPGGVDCTNEARPSAVVTLQDETGEPIWEGDLSFSTPTMADQPCEDWGGGDFVCGWEVAGPMTIHADAWGWGPASVEIDVPADACHVQTQQVVVTLPWLACPDVEMYAVMVHPIDEQGQPVRDARVEAMPYGENWTAPEPCERWEGNTFACGLGWTGEVEVWAQARGVGSFYDVVDVPFDECGPLTVDLTAVLSR
jgi:hypothetical protein